MSDPFERMHASLMAKLGVEATLAGVPARVNIEHGVAYQGEHSDAVVYRSVADIPASLSPKVGQTLVVGPKTYAIDAIEASNGYSTRCILL